MVQKLWSHAAIAGLVVQSLTTVLAFEAVEIGECRAKAKWLANAVSTKCNASDTKM